MIPCKPKSWRFLKNFSNAHTHALQRAGVIPLPSLIGLCEGWEWVPDVFEQALSSKKLRPPPPAEKPEVLDNKRSEVVANKPAEDAAPLKGTSLATTFLKIKKKGGTTAEYVVDAEIMFWQDTNGDLRCGFYDHPSQFHGVMPEIICRAMLGTPLGAASFQLDWNTETVSVCSKLSHTDTVKRSW